MFSGLASILNSPNIVYTLHYRKEERFVAEKQIAW